MNLARALRASIWSLSTELQIPYSIVYDENTYFQYISLFRNEIPGLLGFDYLGYRHKHGDWYVHTTKREIAEKIIKKGYLDLDKASENGGVGKAIYTFPLYSGRRYVGDDMCIILFKSDVEHIHLVGEQDSIHSLGECIFTEKHLGLVDCKLVNDEELKVMEGDKYISPSDIKHYFGIPEEIQQKYGNRNYDNLQEYVENSFSDAMFTDDFYSQLRKDFELNESFGNTNLFR